MSLYSSDGELDGNSTEDGEEQRVTADDPSDLSTGDDDDTSEEDASSGSDSEGGPQLLTKACGLLLGMKKSMIRMSMALCVLLHMLTKITTWRLSTATSKSSTSTKSYESSKNSECSGLPKLKTTRKIRTSSIGVATTRMGRDQDTKIKRPLWLTAGRSGTL